MAKRPNRRVWWVAVVVLYSLAVQVRAPSSPRAWRAQLLETGEFHGDEVRAWTGERWLGLYVSKGKASLIRCRLRVRRVHDVIMDEQPGDRSGKAVSVLHHADPVFLVRNAAVLRPGPVTTIYRGRRPLTNGSDVRLKLAGAVYHLRVVSRGKPGEEVSPDARLVLSRGEARQVLYDLRGKASNLWGGEWNLDWAGDLDHDDQLDLYVELSRHYNVSQRKLFLSSPARRDQLVREIGGFETTGC